MQRKNNITLDWDETLKLCNGNEDLAQELMQMLKSDLPRQKQILNTACDKQDMRIVRDIVHQILGTCSYISLPRLKAAAESLQKEIQQESPAINQKQKTLIAAIDAVIMLNGRL